MIRLWEPSVNYPILIPPTRTIDRILFRVRMNDM